MFIGGGSSQQSPQLCEVLTQRYSINKIFFGGDFITHCDTDKNAMKMLGRNFVSAFSSFENVSFFPVIGNHDLNSYEQKNEAAIFDISELKEIVAPVLKNNEHLVQGPYGSYYFDDETIRYICLNTSYQKYVDEQKPFIYQALMTTKKSIIIIAHIWLEWDYGLRTYLRNAKTNELIDIFDAYNLRISTQGYNFSDATGNIILLIGGHIHNDFSCKTTSGIPVVLVDADAIEKTCTKYLAIRGAPSEQCFDVIIIKDNIAEFIRIGHGRDFKVHLVNR